MIVKLDELLGEKACRVLMVLRRRRRYMRPGGAGNPKICRLPTVMHLYGVFSAFTQVFKTLEIARRDWAKNLRHLPADWSGSKPAW